MRKWESLGIEYKLHILIQGSLIVFFVFTHQWMAGRLESQLLETGQARAAEIADGLINGMNMLMLTGTISDPANRRLLLRKMEQSEGVRELRIVRAPQVQEQFGPGLPEEQPRDDLDRLALDSGRPVFRDPGGDAVAIRVVVPFIASRNFRGTDCLSCHRVREGSVNGAASVVVDLSQERAAISQLKKWLWAGQLAFQVLLSIILALFVRGVVALNISGPVRKLRAAMVEIGQGRDYSRRADVDANNADIGDMAKSFNLLMENLTLFAKVFENSGEAIVITDAQNNIISMNRAFTQVTGYEPEEAIGRNPKLMSSGMHDAAFYRAMWQKIREEGGWKGEIYNRRKSGEVYPEWLSISTIRDAAGKIVNYVSLFTDITSRKEAERHIQFLAQYDPLTKLPNRRLFEDRLGQMVASARRYGHRAALLFIDLDRFKTINDSLGHLAGDELLQAVAGRLGRCVRESDTVARVGGDEFVVILGEINEPNDAAHISQKMLDAMASCVTLNGHRVNAGLSIGISIYPDDGADGETLVRHADAALYHAKACGRNNFQFFTPQMNTRAMELISMETELREAIVRKEFLLHYQPKVCAKSGRIIGAEALVRWLHPEKGMMPPTQFIPVAEESGLIVHMGEWVLREACAQNVKWQEAGILHVPVAVNVSVLQFHAGSFADLAQRILRETGLHPRYLEIEITESILMDKVEATIRALRHLDVMGVRLSIDDFGTGYSSLSYLNRFPIDALKIDRSFVQDIVGNKGNAAITRTIIALGHHLELSVVAEGVETPEQYEFLRAEGCDEIQGYYFSRPLAADDFIRYAAAKAAMHSAVGGENSAHRV